MTFVEQKKLYILVCNVLFFRENNVMCKCNCFVFIFCGASFCSGCLETFIWKTKHVKLQTDFGYYTPDTSANCQNIKKNVFKQLKVA